MIFSRVSPVSYIVKDLSEILRMILLVIEHTPFGSIERFWNH